MAHALTVAQVEPTLPAPGIAGIVPTEEILDGQLRDQLGDPERGLAAPREVSVCLFEGRGGGRVQTLQGMIEPLLLIYIDR